MNRLILLFAIFMVTISVANAKYIPYKQLIDYTFSKESGWRSEYQSDYIIVGTVLDPEFDKSVFTVHITKKLYNELSKYSDYKSKLKKIEWTDLNNDSKSYRYELILPISLLDNHSINMKPGMISIYGKKDAYKICKGTSNIDKNGFIWCYANELEDLVK